MPLLRSKPSEPCSRAVNSTRREDAHETRVLGTSIISQYKLRKLGSTQRCEERCEGLFRHERGQVRCTRCQACKTRVLRTGGAQGADAEGQDTGTQGVLSEAASTREGGHR